MGAELVITLLLGLLDRATQITTLIQTARTEGRDITPAELDALVEKDNVARKALDDAIAKAKAEGR